MTTDGKAGTISATPYVAPTDYAITVSGTTNGTVTANPASAPSGTPITLTIAPSTGYELNDISANKTDDAATIVTLSGTGSTRTFTMPDYDVTVTATFEKTQAQLDKEAVEEAKAAVEGGTFHTAQATGNDATTVKTWLVNTLNLLFGETHNVQFRSAADQIVGDVTVTDITPAVAGTETTPDGTNGSFKFTVTLTKGGSTLTTNKIPGVIVATPYTFTPVKCIELLLTGNLTARILNTGNVATGNLTLALTGENADAFTLSATTVSSLAVGYETEITLIPGKGLAAGTYNATLTVSGEGLTPVSIEITYTEMGTGIDNPQASLLKAYIQNGILHVNGLTAGKPWSVYNMTGICVYQDIAKDEKADFILPVRGVYVVTSGNQPVKVVY